MAGDWAQKLNQP